MCAFLRRIIVVLILVQTAEENTSDMFSSHSELENQIHDPSAVTSLMDSSPIYYQEASQASSQGSLSLGI
jgi:hypothetical protein